MARGLASGTVSEALNALGFGGYQVRVFILAAGFIVAENAELSMASALVNPLGAHFGVTSAAGKSSLMVAVYLGLMTGTIASGPLGDRFGRRLPMFVGYIGVIVCALLVCLSSSVPSLILLRFTQGVASGIGIPTALISISEVSPEHLRGLVTAAMGLSYCLGDVWAAVGLCVIMPDLQDGPWRLLLCWALVPSVCMLLAGSLTAASRYDTPYFLAAQGRKEELSEAINLIADLNGRPELRLAPGDHLSMEVRASEHGNFWHAVRTIKGNRLVHVLILCMLFFAKDFGLYGSGVFWPKVWAGLGSTALPPSGNLLITALTGIPGNILAMYLMFVLPRRVALAFGSGVCCAACIAMRSLDDGKAIGYVGALTFKMMFPGWQMVTMLLPSELFPTQIRAICYGIVAAAGRLATLLVPFLVEANNDLFLMCCACLAGLACISVTQLPETKDAQLKNDEPELMPDKVLSYGSAGAAREVVERVG